ncbi:MAG: glutamate--cysteine ligase [Myxococcales bacterium]
MGISIDRTDFSPHDYVRFRDRLAADLGALAQVLSRRDFGLGPLSVGTELEVNLIDDAGQPKACNEEVLARLADPQVTVEINRFNLEFNAQPALLRGRPFADMRSQLERAVARLRSAAAEQGARVAIVGILPTLRLDDLGLQAFSDRPRYHALSKALRRKRGEPFRVHIEGRDSLQLRVDDVSLEGANTSFQIHLRVPAHSFVHHYNAAQLAAAPVLAVAGNSPFFAQHRLWEETRVALFKQAVDVRTDPRESERGRSRVSFGKNWIAHPIDPFMGGAIDHDVVLPVTRGDDPFSQLAHGQAPELEVLRLHHSTVWSWNRAVYDPVDGGHLRIEHRSLPAGPTVADMVANAAFTLGLTLSLAEHMDELVRVMPFEAASRNFYAAAKRGLLAELSWPDAHGSLRARGARELVFWLLPEAARGLASAGVHESDYGPFLELIRLRTESMHTGAQVQRALLEHHARSLPMNEAFVAALEHYLALGESGRPVHTWPLPSRRFTSLESRAES